MSSGIYKLTFKDGSIYIGKSVDVSKRWSQHSKAMLKGTHTKKMQEIFDEYGSPEYEIIFECHPDHIDILEGYFINVFWNNNILNTTRPPLLSTEDQDLLRTVNTEVWGLSTFDHLRAWKQHDARANALESKITRVKNGSLVEELEDEIEDLEEIVAKLTHERDAIANRGFFARLFNY